VVEEPDDEAMADGGNPLGPGMAEFVGTWIKILRSRNADPTFGRHMEGVLKAAGCFDVVNVKKVIIPISGKSDGMYSISIKINAKVATEHFSLLKIPKKMKSGRLGSALCKG